MMGARLALVSASALSVAVLFGAGAAAQAPAPGEVSFSVPTLFPDFGPNIHDYVVRCNDGPVTVTAHASGGWEVKIGNHPFRTGDFSEAVPLGAGRAFTVTARRSEPAQVSRYHVRCLPNDFPQYIFTRYGPMSPEYFTVENVLAPFSQRYAMIFNDHGVPVWWYKAPTHDTKVLPSGNVVWLDYSAARFEIHRLDGSLVRTLNTVGHPVNDHDLQLLGNGDHLIGSNAPQSHVDTSAYGGSSDATVRNTELQQVSPGGQLVWSWNTRDHISLAETGRWWSYVIDHGYDINHWNAIEPAGGPVIASFRHLDAVYRIRKSTGNIVWKLGGTKTSKSLTVKNDPRQRTFGGQHDARLLPDGTLTVFDNHTAPCRARRPPSCPQGDESRPRAVRFRINEQDRTATLVESIADPGVRESTCCGSARRLANGDWLISWGGRGDLIGGYKPSGQRTFVLRFSSNRTYRAQPVPAGAVTAADLRAGMRAMAQAAATGS